MLIKDYDEKRIFIECIRKDNDLMKLFNIFNEAGYRYCENYLYQTKDYDSDYIMDVCFENKYEYIVYTIKFNEFEKGNIMIYESYLTA